jgi:hypothetical protein
MKAARARFRFRRTPDLARRALLLFALTAFALQGYVTQTHIHFAPGSFGAMLSDTGKIVPVAQSAEKDGTLPRDKWPANDDPANCPICQEMIHSGAFVTPTVAALALPTEVFSVIAIVIDVPQFTSAVSHSWRGRGPPRN